MSVEQPFKIPVPKDALALLNYKLELHSTAGRGQHAEWAYGAPLTDIRRLDSRWRDGYDWRPHERELNALPVFTHTIGVEGFGELGVPLTVPSRFYSSTVPGSFLEVTKILPLLTAVSADHPSSHVIAPKKSLPGFAWLEGVLEKGFHAEHFTELFNKLMISLGYSEYTTKPQTLGFSLADPPVSLFAWTYEKLVTWTDAYPRTDDKGGSQFIRSRAGPVASIRIYYELALAGQVKRNLAPFPIFATFLRTTVLVGLSYFLKDVVQFPRVWLRAQGKIVFESEHEVGGHFAAYEQPSAFVGDLRKMFGQSACGRRRPGCAGY
ncbi:epoxide hydrolase [Lactarius pseudohatsudake]|nr:epoxide hydrolase [Lactarius pseudohatsudake]